MNYKYLFPLVLIVAVIATIIIAINSIEILPSTGGQPNVQARIATTTTAAVGPQQNKTLFTAKDLCASRTISTAGSAVMLSFDANVTPTASIGLVQGASTTVAYTADLYGCGTVTAYGFASTTITTSDFTF